MSQTWNPSDKGANITLSGGNLSAAGATAFNAVRCTGSKSTGKWYWENKVTAANASASLVGWGTGSMSLMTFVGGSAGSAGIGTAGNTFVGTGFTNVNAAGVTWAANDFMDFAVDYDAGNLWLGKNGTWVASGNPVTGANPWCTFTPNTALFPAWSSADASNTGTANFGASAFANTVPSGFSAFNNFSFAAAAGSFAVTGASITMARGLHILCAPGSFAVTGASIILTKGYRLLAAAGSFTVTVASIALVRVIADASKNALRRAAFVLQKLRVNPPTLDD